ncbi:MAG TPA: DoxX family protein [Candidatus Binatia bacterium]|jgi:putative oxidoreductase|nr:DoxX family protein [Candidatus Binatia bacterium]
MPSQPNSLIDSAAVLARWVLGAIFIYMGLHKVLDPVGFLKLVNQYHLVSEPFLLNSIAAVLPWFEVFCGLLLLAGVGVRGAALMLIVMLIPFTLVVFLRAQEIVATQGISFWSVKFDCGCGTGEILVWHKLIENPLLILLSGWLLFSGRGRAFSARFGLFGTPAVGSPATN